jgi:hypothetical protein
MTSLSCISAGPSTQTAEFVQYGMGDVTDNIEHVGSLDANPL